MILRFAICKIKILHMTTKPKQNQLYCWEKLEVEKLL